MVVGPWRRAVLPVCNGKPITPTPVEADKRREDQELILF